MKNEASQPIATITARDEEEVRQQVGPLLERAQSLTITDAASYQGAAEFLQSIKGAQKILQRKRDSIEKPIKAALKAIKDFFAAPEASLAQAESLAKRALVGWDEEQERLRQEAQRKADAEAAAQRRKLAEQAAAAQAKAQAAHDAGKIDQAAKQATKAQVLEQTAATVVAPTIVKEVPKVAGLTYRDVWSAAVDDLPKLVISVALGVLPDDAPAEVTKYLMSLQKAPPETRKIDLIAPIASLVPNMTFLNTQARALQTELHYPGVRAIRTRVPASGSR